MEKLDRVLVNDAWIDAFPYARALFDSSDVSDHLPARVFLCEVQARKFDPFRFKNVWTKEEGLRDVVCDSWQGSLTGTRQFRVAQKLKRVKGGLKLWSKELSSDLETAIEQDHAGFVLFIFSLMRIGGMRLSVWRSRVSV